MNGTKTATSAICTARVDGEKPVVKIETQIPKTISDKVSDTRVAPTVTTTGSVPRAPRRLTIGKDSKVCEASSEPMTMAGMIAYPNASPNAVPSNCGTTVVT